jgi:hypothetical protein
VRYKHELRVIPGSDQLYAVTTDARVIGVLRPEFAHAFTNRDATLLAKLHALCDATMEELARKYEVSANKIGVLYIIDSLPAYRDALRDSYRMSSESEFPLPRPIFHSFNNNPQGAADRVAERVLGNFVSLYDRTAGQGGFADLVIINGPDLDAIVESAVPVRRRKNEAA